MIGWRETQRIVLITAMLGLLAACGPTEKKDAKIDVPPRAQPVRVVTTHPVVHEALLKVAGDRVHASCLRRATDSRRTFDLHAGDVELLADADVVFVIGAGHEKATLDTVAAHAKRVLRLAEHRDAAALRGAHSPTDDAGECWVNPLVLRQFVMQIEREIAALDPANAGTFAQGGERFREELSALSSWIDATVKPVQRGAMVTNDDLAAELAKACWMSVIRIDLDASKPVRELDRAAVDGAVLTVKAKVIAIDGGGQRALAEMLDEVAKAHGAIVVTPAIAPPREGEGYVDWVRTNVKNLAGLTSK